MEFAISEEGRLIEEQVVRFIDDKIIPAERTYADQVHTVPSGDDPPNEPTQNSRLLCQPARLYLVYRSNRR